LKRPPGSGRKIWQQITVHELLQKQTIISITGNRLCERAAEYPAMQEYAFLGMAELCRTEGLKTAASQAYRANSRKETR
jgi:hypothetical protein